MNKNMKLLTLVVFLITLVVTAEIDAQVTSEQEKNIYTALPEQPVEIPKKKRRLLVFSRTEGYRHDAIPFANKTIELMGKKTGAFEAVFSEEMSVFKAENLKEFDAILLNNTTNLKFEDPALRKSLLDFIKNGKGLMGIHAATDNFYNWPEAAEMLGGQFDGHPWDGQGIWAVQISDPSHKLNEGFENSNFRINDEIYHHKIFNLRENSRVIVGLDMRDSVNRSAKGVHFTDNDIPISWVRKYDKGRVFYCSFGHAPSIYWNKEILSHYLAGIQFVLGDLPASTDPIPFDINKVLDFEQLSKNLAKIAHYEFGQSREAHVAVQQFVSLASQSTKATSRTESELIKFLRSDATLAGKQFVSHLIADIGSEAAIEILSEMLFDPSTAEMARFALEEIPNRDVDVALRSALMKTDNNVKIGIINSLGIRRDQKSVSQIQKLIYSSDPQIARASIIALGKIGSEQAITQLEEAEDKVSPEIREVLINALLDCADVLLIEKKNERANKIYEDLFDPSEENQIRFAALRGMVNSSSEEDANKLLINVLMNEKNDLRSRVPMIVRELPANYNISGLIGALPSFKSADQVSLLNALSNRKDDYILQMALQLSKDENQAVRSDAFLLIGKVGNYSTVQYLVEVSLQNSVDSKSALNALHQLSGVEVDLEIVDLIPDSDDEMKLQLIRTLRIRRPEDKDSKISKALLLVAQTENENLQIESIRALQFIAGTIDLQQLVDLLVKAESDQLRRALERTIIVTAKKNNGEFAATEILLSALSQSNEIQTRRSLLLVLAKVGDSSALPAFKEAIQDTSKTLQTASIKALAEWATDEPIDELERIIRESSNPTHRTIALRGFVRMSNLNGDNSDLATIDRFKLAMELSETNDDKKMVLSGLSNVKSYAAFQMAVEQLNYPALRGEAEVAVVNIAAETVKTHPEETKKALLEIRQNSKDENIIKLAQKHINEIEKYEGFITLWQLSEVYSNDEDDDFYFEFPPEKDGENVVWTTMTEISDTNTPWQVNLTNIFGGNFCAGYMRTNVWSDKELKARIELGSNDGMKAWFNGKLILSQDVSRTVAPSSDVIEIKLNKGWNNVMLKIRQLGGSWGACARIRNVDGSKIENLKYEPDRDE